MLPIVRSRDPCTFSTFIRTMSSLVHTVAQVGFAAGTNELYDRYRWERFHAERPPLTYLVEYDPHTRKTVSAT